MTNRMTLSDWGVRGAMLALCAFALASCDPDLDVDNINDPDRSRALATGSDVETLIQNTFNAYIDVSQSNLGAGVSECSATAWTAVLNAMADHSTSNWSNYGFARTANQPRTAIPNSSANEDACLMSTIWFRAYQGLAAASEGLRALNEGGIQIGEEGEDNARARAWAKMNQGLLHGMLGMIYDKAFVVDEETELVDDQGNAVIPEFSNYMEVRDAAIGYLQEAISIAESNDFTTPATWTNGTELTSSQIAALAHSYIARFMVRTPRNPSEAENVDWAAVESHLAQGHTFDLTIGGTSPFWSGLKVWGSGGGLSLQLALVDNKTVGPADTTGAYQDWLAAPVNGSDPFDVQSPDERIPEPVDSDIGCWNPSFTGPAEDAPRCGKAPSWIGYHASTFQPSQRGVIGLSHYSRYEQYFGETCDFFSSDFSFTGQICEFTQRDKDFLMAEALMRQGDMAGGADIINDYRVPASGLPPADASGVQGQTNCVPKTPDGSCGDLWDVLQYEKGLAVFTEYSGDMWADKRRWGTLTTGTATQLPVPASELETIGREIYTFGGDAGSAAPVIQENDSESILRKVKWSLQVLEQQRQERRAARPDLGARKGAASPPTIVN